MKKTISMSLLALFILCQVEAQTVPTSTNVEAKQILDKATEYQKAFSTCFSESDQERKINGISAKTTLSVYQKRNADGQVMQRIEAKVSIAKPSVNIDNLTIINSEGTWRISNGLAILETYKAKERQDMFSSAAASAISNMQTDQEAVTYEMEKKQVNGIACDVVKMHFSDKAIRQWQGYATAANGVPSADEDTPSFREVVIGADDKLIYGDTIYSTTGAVINQQQYNIVKYNVPIDDQLFQIPATLKKVTANSQQDERLLIEAETK